MAARVGAVPRPEPSTSTSSRRSTACASVDNSLSSGSGPAHDASKHSVARDESWGRSLGMEEASSSCRRESRRNLVGTSHRSRGDCRYPRDSGHGMLLVCTVVALVLTQLTVHVSAATVGCPSSSFSPYYPSNTCYGYFQTSLNFFEAHVQCRSHNNGYLAVISNAGELRFVQDAIRNKTTDTYKAWIGLTDKAVEGTFAWVGQGTTAKPAVFDASLWAKGQPEGLGNDHDCVVLEADGFHVSALGCSEDTGHFFVCQQEMCVGTCAEAVISTATGTDSGVIAGIVIAVVLFILVILALLYTWKFHNDKWELYVCYLCKMRESKTQVHSLQQENQRLRRQLSQQKSVSQISLTGMSDIPGPNDGAGGVLPTLRPMAQMGTNVPNNAAALLPTTPNSTSPPPLRRQSTSQASTGVPMLSRNSTNMSLGQPRPGSLSMSRQTSLLGGNRGRVMPDNGAPGGGMGGINSPRAGFVNLPPAFPGGQGGGGPGAGRVSMSRNTSISSAFGGAQLASPQRPAKVSIVPEFPDLEEKEAAALEAGRPASRTSLPGGAEDD